MNTLWKYGCALKGVLTKFANSPINNTADIKVKVKEYQGFFRNCFKFGENLYSVDTPHNCIILDNDGKEITKKPKLSEKKCYKSREKISKWLTIKTKQAIDQYENLKILTPHNEIEHTHPDLAPPSPRPSNYDEDYWNPFPVSNEFTFASFGGSKKYRRNKRKSQARMNKSRKGKKHINSKRRKINKKRKNKKQSKNLRRKRVNSRKSLKRR